MLSSVSAKVLPIENDTAYRRVALRAMGERDGRRTERDEIKAKVIVVADGLGHPSLKETKEFREIVQSRSHIGIGASLMSNESSSWFRSGCIFMAATHQGYGGVVRVEDGNLNLAAAVSPALLKSLGSPHAAFRWLLQRAKFPELPVDGLTWRGTPALSRRIDQVVGHRILVVGDAAGYVEPFTGEGIAWAVIGGHSVARAAAEFASDDCEQARHSWNDQWSSLVAQRQQWCRRLAWLLRHPTAARLGVSLAATFPRLTDRIVNQMNAEQIA